MIIYPVESLEVGPVAIRSVLEKKFETAAAEGEGRWEIASAAAQAVWQAGSRHARPSLSTILCVQPAECHAAVAWRKPGRGVLGRPASGRAAMKREVRCAAWPPNAR